jgi:hypothetical protein
MKTAVEIPNHVFAEAERLAGRLGASRSGLYARALAEFLAKHGDHPVTAAMNAVVDRVGTKTETFTNAAARQALRRAEW